MHREDNDRFRMFSRRTAVLGGLKFALLGVLVGRMYQLQVLESDRYRMLSDENRISLRLLPPPRGRIVDRYGDPLAVNRENYRVLLVAEKAGDVERALEILSRLIPIGEYERRRVRREIKRRRSFVPICSSTIWHRSLRWISGWPIGSRGLRASSWRMRVAFRTKWRSTRNARPWWPTTRI